MSAYYNEIDPKAAAWLRELIQQGLIADGEVDERSIVDVRADDVRGFDQCHWFAGIGGWSYALRLAGWADDRFVWTGSCPCQPFSSAGAQVGGADSRDLWPAWRVLIAQCRPSVVFGEQVEAAIGHGWLDRLCDDLEAEGYAVGPVGLPSASIGAFDIRQRLWFVADANGRQSSNGELQRGRGDVRQPQDSAAGVVADTDDARSQGRLGAVLSERADQCAARSGGSPDELAHADDRRREEPDIHVRPARQNEAAAVKRGAGYWGAADWIPCADGKSRPVEPGTFPLAHGLPARVGRLRGYGNAINPYVAAEVIGAYMEIS